MESQERKYTSIELAGTSLLGNKASYSHTQEALSEFLPVKTHKILEHVDTVNTINHVSESDSNKVEKKINVNQSLNNKDTLKLDLENQNDDNNVAHIFRFTDEYEDEDGDDDDDYDHEKELKKDVVLEDPVQNFKERGSLKNEDKQTREMSSNHAFNEEDLISVDTIQSIEQDQFVEKDDDLLHVNSTATTEHIRHTATVPKLSLNTNVDSHEIMISDLKEHTPESLHEPKELVSDDYIPERFGNTTNLSGNPINIKTLAGNRGDVYISPLRHNVITASPLSKGDSVTHLSHKFRFQNERSDDLDYIVNDNFRMQFPPNSNAAQRSSIYESRPKVTAIPILTPNYKRNGYANSSLHGSKTGHVRGRSKDLDDSSSIHSLSSSLTASFSKNFLFGFYKNKHTKRKKQQIALLPKQYWMKDENCRECFACGKNFNTFRRKHHCRVCGQIFCSNCTLLIPAEKFGYEGKIRICESCLEHCENDYSDDSSEDDLSIMNENTTRDDDTMDMSDHLLLHSIVSDDQTSNDMLTGGLNDGHSEVSLRLNNATDVVSLFGKDDSRVLTESLNAPKMTIPATKTGESLEIGAPDHTKNHISFKTNTNHNHATHNTPIKKVHSEISRVRGILRGHSRDQSREVDATTLPYTDQKYLGPLKPYTGFLQSNIFPENDSYNNEILANNSVAHKLASGNFKFEFRMTNHFNNGTRSKNVLPRVNSMTSLNRLPSHSGTGKLYINSDSLNAPNGTALQEGYALRNRISFGTTNELKSTASTSTLEAFPDDRNNQSSLNKRLMSPGELNENEDISNDADVGYEYNSDSGEDEGSMSIFAALNNDQDSQYKRNTYDDLAKVTSIQKQTQFGERAITEQGQLNYTDKNYHEHHRHNQNGRGIRNDTKSFQRAEASLQRIRTRRQSRSKSVLSNNKNLQLFSHSTPNLLSILSNDNERPVSHESRHRYKPDGISKRLISTSSYNTEHKTNLSETLQAHAQSLLNQVLTDQNNLDVSQWTGFFLEVLRPIESIEVNAKTTGSLDFRQYVKIKRISGGVVSQSELINGVVFSKNNPLKHMPRTLKAPRILLLMFPLSYQKTDNHLLSLKVLLDQEKEYLDSLVSRVKALNPNLIFVSDNVSGYALNLLHKAGIVVQFNIKPQVLEKISRFTEADIANSVDKLVANTRLGSCELFEVKTFVYGDIGKTYTFLRGCKPNLGATILLRGLDMDSLRTLKDTAEFMVFVILTMKLESSMLKDNFVELFFSEYNKMTVAKKNRKSIGYFGEFVQKFNQRILSISPSIDFPLPFLLERTRMIEDKIAVVKKAQAKLATLDEDQFQSYIGSDPFLGEIQGMKGVSLDDMKYFSQFILEKHVEVLTETFFLKKKQWEIFFLLSYNMLGTGTHQSISVLYSMVSNKTGTPCIGPQVVTVEYFWNNDVTIGQFIENVVTTLHFPCSAACGGTFMDHYRSYVHGESKIDVVVERLQSRLPALKNIILMWTYCKKCKLSSPILQMSDNTWNYSFGKYLELIFWSVSTCMGGLGNCNHDVLRDHVKYFSYNDIVIRLEYSRVDIHQLVTPKTKISWTPNFNIKAKIKLTHSLHSKIDEFYESVLKRLFRVKLDSKENSEDALKIIEQMKNNASQEKSSFHESVRMTYKNTPGDECLQLNSTLQKLHLKSFEWNSSFAEFEKKYLPSERDIARITASQLKKMFLDSGIDVGSDSQKEGDIKESDLDTDDKSKLSQVENSKDVQDEEFLKDVRAEDQQIENQAATSDFKNNFVDTFKSPQPEQKEYELSKHLRKMSTDSKDNQTTVSKLASFFDQMHFDALSKEFEHQREIERKQIDKKYHKKLWRSEPAKPIVEIYKNVNDAVNEPLHMEKSDHSALSYDRKNVNNGQIAESLSTAPKGFVQNRRLSSFDVNAFEEPTTSTEPSKNMLPLPPITTTTTTTADRAFLDESDSDIDQEQNEVPESPLGQAGQAQQQEKNSLLKLLSNFWADRSATLWEPLESPLGATEHIFADNNILIKEDEPTSLVAFCLSSSDYIEKMTQSYTSAKVGGGMDADLENTELLENLLNKKTAMHLRYQLQDDSVVMSCKIFFAEQFDAFRRACGCTQNFIQSLSRCVKWDSSGGKSGSAFLKTLDDRFVIKELSHVELDTFIKFAPNYFHYMGQAMFHDLPTALAKILGFYQIHIKNTETGKVFKKDVIITENLFYDRKNLRIFDLKGSMRNRHVEQTGKENEVLLDENMVEYIYESPVFVREYDKKLLRASLWNDTLFLSKMNVMDYSLVIGIDNENQKLTVGIIDCIRTFTWDKKLESWVKEKGFVGNSTKEPTVVTPKQYKNRFREAMERYILVVPDPWYKENITKDDQ